VAELVLIVDDNELNTKLTRDVLEQAGMHTLSAATATEGLRLARAHHPDVVLMDLRLPDLDGAEAAKQLAADTQTAHIPVVALSALRMDDGGAWARAAGFADYIEKPIDIRELAAQIRGHCSPR
jgi:two-component system, cell cycle response regulator DivK